MSCLDGPRALRAAERTLLAGQRTAESSDIAVGMNLSDRRCLIEAGVQRDVAIRD